LCSAFMFLTMLKFYQLQAFMPEQLPYLKEMCRQKSLVIMNIFLPGSR
jgi:hypothetical protein